MDRACVAESTQSDQQPAEAPKNLIGYWFIWPALIPLVYALSIGPVAKVDLALDLQHKHPREQKALEAFYKPLTLLCEKFPEARRFYVWYFNVVVRVRPST
jgi:hypothetical protein